MRYSFRDFRGRALCIAAFLSALCTAGPFLCGQAHAAAISSAVTGSTGAAVPGAKATITNQWTGISHDATTDNSGFLSDEGLTVGPYRVDVTKPGFKESITNGVEIEAGQRRAAGIRLEVGNEIIHSRFFESAPNFCWPTCGSPQRTGFCWVEWGPQRILHSGQNKPRSPPWVFRQTHWRWDDTIWGGYGIGYSKIPTVGSYYAYGANPLFMQTANILNSLLSDGTAGGFAAAPTPESLRSELFSFKPSSIERSRSVSSRSILRIFWA